MRRNEQRISDELFAMPQHNEHMAQANPYIGPLAGMLAELESTCKALEARVIELEARLNGLGQHGGLDVPGVVDIIKALK